MKFRPFAFAFPIDWPSLRLSSSRLVISIRSPLQRDPLERTKLSAAAAAAEVNSSYFGSPREAPDTQHYT